jgi:hypothetical protein
MHHSPLHQAMGLLLPISLLLRPMGHLGAEMEEAMVLVAKTSNPDLDPDRATGLLAVYVTLPRSPPVSTVDGPYVPARAPLLAADSWASPGGMLSLLL